MPLSACDLKMRVCALDVDEVDRTVADDAVGDIDVTAAREPDLRHPRRVAWA